MAGPARPDGRGDAEVRRATWPAAAAALLVAAVIGVSSLLGGARGSGPPPPPPDPTQPDGRADLVPWAPLAPSSWHFLSEAAPAEADSAAGLPPCAADDLDASTTLEGTWTGSAGLFVELRARSGVTCAVQGRPEVALLEDGELLPIVTAPDPGDDYPSPVRVSDRDPAVLVLWSSMDWCEASVVNNQIRLTLPGESGSLESSGFLTSLGCDRGLHTGAGPPTVRVSTFQPPWFVAQRLIHAVEGVTVAIDRRGVAVVGDDLRFVVTLVAHPPRAVVLEPCPDYVISLREKGGGRTELRYALNCGRVPFRDPVGRPVLPIGVAVRFDIAPPTHGECRACRWRLDVPGSEWARVPRPDRSP